MSEDRPDGAAGRAGDGVDDGANESEDVESVTGTDKTASMDDAQAAPAATSARVPVAELARRQRNIVIMAVCLAAACLVGGAASGYPLAGVFLAVGIGLALLNTVATEVSMMRMTATGDDLSRKQFAVSALMRLSAISVVALVLVVVFWDVGGGFVLGGLAVFQVLIVALTGLPLLKELRNS